MSETFYHYFSLWIFFFVLMCSAGRKGPETCTNYTQIHNPVVVVIIVLSKFFLREAKQIVFV